jgi:hypothetical protein
LVTYDDTKYSFKKFNDFTKTINSLNYKLNSFKYAALIPIKSNNSIIKIAYNDGGEIYQGETNDYLNEWFIDNKSEI